MSMTMLVLFARERQQPMKTLKSSEGNDFKRLLMMLAYCSAYAKQFLRMFYYEQNTSSFVV